MKNQSINQNRELKLFYGLVNEVKDQNIKDALKKLYNSAFIKFVCMKHKKDTNLILKELKNIFVECDASEELTLAFLKLIEDKVCDINVDQCLHREQFQETLRVLKEEPFAYEQRCIERGDVAYWSSKPRFHPENFKKERYWFMIVLKDTPYTIGSCEFAGWNSGDDAKVARGEYEYENAVAHNEYDSYNEFECDDCGHKDINCFYEVDIESDVYFDLGEPDRCNTCFNIWKNSKDAEEYVKLVDNREDREYCAVKEWVKESVSSANVDDWQWNGNERVLTIYNGDDTEEYSWQELIDTGLVVERNNKSKTLLCDGDNCEEDGGYGHCIKCKSTFCKDHFKGEWYECEQYDKTKAENIENKLKFEKTLPDIGHPGICMECFVTNDEESEEEISVPSTSEDDEEIQVNVDESTDDVEVSKKVPRRQLITLARRKGEFEEDAVLCNTNDTYQVLADGSKVIKSCDGKIFDKDSFEYLGMWNDCDNTVSDVDIEVTRRQLLNPAGKVPRRQLSTPARRKEEPITETMEEAYHDFFCDNSLELKKEPRRQLSTPARRKEE